MYYVYLLKSLKDKKYYIGFTSDIHKRLKAHNTGKNKSTKRRRPFKLVGFETYKESNKARWREYELKNKPSKKKRFIKTLLQAQKQVKQTS